MRRVYPPPQDRRAARDCAYALEPAFMQLLDRAEQAGWGREEALAAIRSLAARSVPADLARTAAAA